MSSPNHDDGNTSTNPGMRVRMGEDFDPETVDERIEAAGPLASPGDGNTRLAEHDLGGAIPREEANWRTFRSAEIYVQLETTIYGPISQQELADLLRSGQLTGYETASNDLQHWTPLLYHPLMVVRNNADIDEGHAVLERRSSLPTASARRRSLLEDLADGNFDELDAPPEPEPTSMPLAAIMIKPKRVPAAQVSSRELPVYGEIRETASGRHIERSAPGTTAPISARPAHPTDLPPRNLSDEAFADTPVDPWPTVDEDPTSREDATLDSGADPLADVDDPSFDPADAESPDDDALDGDTPDGAPDARSAAGAAADSLLPPVWLLVVLILGVAAFGAWLLVPRLL